jgi:hypothetical protein
MVVQLLEITVKSTHYKIHTYIRNSAPSYSLASCLRNSSDVPRYTQVPILEAAMRNNYCGGMRQLAGRKTIILWLYSLTMLDL